MIENKLGKGKQRGIRNALASYITLWPKYEKTKQNNVKQTREVRPLLVTVMLTMFPLLHGT